MEIQISVYHNHYVTEKYEETYGLYVYIIYSIYSVIDLKSLARLNYDYTCIYYHYTIADISHEDHSSTM